MSGGFSFMVFFLPVDGDERQVLLLLAQVVQRVRELYAVRDQEVDVF